MKYNTYILSALFMGATLATSSCFATSDKTAKEIITKEFDVHTSSSIELKLMKPYQDLLARPKGPKTIKGTFVHGNKNISYEMQIWMLGWPEVLPPDIIPLIPYNYFTGILKIDNKTTPFSVQKHTYVAIKQYEKMTR